MEYMYTARRFFISFCNSAPLFTLRQSYRQHESGVHEISKFVLYSFKLSEESLIYILYKVIQTT